MGQCSFKIARFFNEISINLENKQRTNVDRKSFSIVYFICLDSFIIMNYNKNIFLINTILIKKSRDMNISI